MDDMFSVSAACQFGDRKAMMKLSQAQSRQIYQTRGSYITEVCDLCGQALGPFNRFTRRGDLGIWCSRECRDGKQAHVPGICKGCGAVLKGKRKGAIYCGRTCRMRATRKHGQDSPIIVNTPIQNTGVTDAILASGYTPRQRVDIGRQKRAWRGVWECNSNHSGEL